MLSRLISVVVPPAAIPTTPAADSLFRGTVRPEGFGPDVLGTYAAPLVLKVAFSGLLLNQPYDESVTHP